MLGVYVARSPVAGEASPAAGLPIGRPAECPPATSRYGLRAAVALEASSDSTPVNRAARLPVVAPPMAVHAPSRPGPLPGTAVEAEPGFIDSERGFLLQQRGIGPGVIARLERCGVHTMNGLAAWVRLLRAEDWPAALASRRNALERAVALWSPRGDGAAQ